MNESVTGKEADSRPYVICHMLASLDGKIDGSFFAAPESRPAMAEYGNNRQAYGCKSVVYGTITMMGGYSEGLAGDLPKAEEHYARDVICCEL